MDQPASPNLNNSYDYYADMAIEKMRESKRRYHEGMNKMSLPMLRNAIRDLKEHRYLVKEMMAILNKAKTDQLNLKKQDIG